MTDLKEAHEKALERTVGFRPGNPGATGPASQMRWDEKARTVSKFLRAMDSLGYRLLPVEALEKAAKELDVAADRIAETDEIFATGFRVCAREARAVVSAAPEEE